MSGISQLPGNCYLKGCNSDDVRRRKLPERCNLKDRLSMLPDDIIVFMLSFLALKEAAVTSLLGKRWRYLWASISNLNFDAEVRLHKIAAAIMDKKDRGEPELLNTERTKYVNFVNHVLSLHSGPNLYEFTICFDLVRHYAQDINKWIEFALSKNQIQRFELNLSDSSGFISFYKETCYVLPLSLLDPVSFGGCKSLKTLSFKSVLVTSEMVGCLLSLCPVLERLSVIGSCSFGRNLKVSGPSLMLKYLEISNCPGLQFIEICDTNLISFSYQYLEADLVLKNVPMLVELSYIRIYRPQKLDDVFGQISCCLHQLEILRLGVFSIKAVTNLHEFAKFPQVKHLLLDVSNPEFQTLFPSTSLVKACPSLESFVLKLPWEDRKRIRREVNKAAIKWPHPYLKVMELRGCYGCMSEVELVTYFCQNAAALEKIVLDCSSQVKSRYPKHKSAIEDEEKAKIITVQQFQGKTPPGVKLVVL